MSTISVPYRIAVETLKTMDDNSKQNLVLPLNQYNEQVNNAFSKGLTIRENTTSAIITQTFVSGTPLVIKNPISIVPVGLTPISGNTSVHSVTNYYLTPQSDQSKISITVVWNDSGSGPVTFILWGG